jgi:hypothetical protein
MYISQSKVLKQLSTSTVLCCPVRFSAVSTCSQYELNNLHVLRMISTNLSPPWVGTWWGWDLVTTVYGNLVPRETWCPTPYHFIGYIQCTFIATWLPTDAGIHTAHSNLQQNVSHLSALTPFTRLRIYIKTKSNGIIKNLKNTFIHKQTNVTCSRVFNPSKACINSILPAL